MKTIKSSYFITSIFLTIILFSCKKEEQKFDFHFGYFGLEQGRYVEYDVMEINHDHNVGKHDTLRYRLKTVVGEKTIDNEGREANKFYRFVYDPIYQQYKVKDLWTAIITDYRAELVEENQRIIKLVFKPSDFKEWNAHAFTNHENYPEMNVYYEKIHKSFSDNGFSFDSTLTVEQDNEPFVYSLSRKYEIYAKGIGLVKKHFQEFSHPQNTPEQAVYGKELFYTLVGFGVE